MTVHALRQTPDDQYPSTPLEKFEYEFTLLAYKIGENEHDISERAVAKRLRLMRRYGRMSRNPLLKVLRLR